MGILSLGGHGTLNKRRAWVEIAKLRVGEMKGSMKKVQNGEKRGTDTMNMIRMMGA